MHLLIVPSGEIMARKLIFVASLLAAIGVAGCSKTADEAADGPAIEPADLVLTGGTIATVDDSLGMVEAIAVSGHRIVAVGTADEIAPYISETTNVVDLAGRFAMPGFIEGHGHFLSYGAAQLNLDLTTADNWNDIVTQVAVEADKSKPGEWILGHGWHQDKWTSLPGNAVDGSPRNDALSEAAPNNPVFLVHASGHASIANAAALEAAGIGAETDDPDGGTIVRDEAGAATGLLRENAQDAVEMALAEHEKGMSPDELEQRARQQVYLASESALAHGITSFQDAGTSFENIDFLRMLEQEGALPIRLYVMVRYEPVERLAELLPHYRMPAEENDFLVVRSIKQQIDGALGVHGAWLLEPYIDMPETDGLVLEPVAQVETISRLAIEHGYQVNTHAIGDRANREVLDIYERIWEEAQVDGSSLRWRIEHAQHVHPDDIPRFGSMGVIASVQGVHCTSDGPWIPDRLGDERALETSYRWRDMIDTGAILNNGTDVPVEAISAIASYYSSVARISKDGSRCGADQAMTREEALKSYTINNAIAAFEEHQKGSLVPGKLADIVVLSENLLTVDEAKLPATQVEMTIVGGEIAYQRGN